MQHGRTYLASVLDVCTRKIVGYCYGRKMDKQLVMSALELAVRNQGYPRDVVIHSDRGSQYTCTQYRELIQRLGCMPSFSKKGCPFDNAPMESFHASLKKEGVYLQHYKTFREVGLALFQYIEGFYNRNRIHSAIGYMTPTAFERLLSA